LNPATSASSEAMPALLSSGGAPRAPPSLPESSESQGLLNLVSIGLLSSIADRS